MTKKTLLLVAFIVSVFVTNAQNSNDVLLSPGENTFTENEWQADEAEEKIKTFKEESIGVLFMPIPLNIDEIKYTLNGSNSETTLVGSDNLFNTGIGVAINGDFNKSGFGFGTIAYFAIIGGDNFKAYDAFVALKYDIALGDKITTNFEVSPLVGIGNLSFLEKVTGDDLALGNSYYFSGGVRVTWRIVNDLYLGADVQTVPLIFNAETLLGLEDQASDVNIHYKFIAQLNLSLRYSIF